MTIDEKIEQARRELQAIVANAERPALQFVNAAASFVSAKSLEVAEKEVKQDHARTKTLGVDGLKAVKAEIRQLCEDRDSISVQLNAVHLWWHRAEKPQLDRNNMSPYNVSSSQLPSSIDHVIRELLARVATVLEKHGYLKSWRNPGSGWVDDGRRRYGGYLEWPAEMRAALGSYAKEFLVCVEKASELSKYEREKAEAEAADLWRKA
jgi:hypothetical protein